MAASELQKKAIYTVVFVGLTLLVLSILPFVESWLQFSMLPQFGMAFQQGKDITWTLTPDSAAVPMYVTYVNALDAFFRILKILLWMAVVIAIVRFLAYLVLRAAYRGSQQSEVSSLLKTVSSIVVYIFAFFLIFQSQYPGISLAPLFTGSTILGIVVGLAIQDTLGNLFAGIAMHTDQSFQIGDVIAIPNRGTGVVESVSWRGVRFRTFQNKLIIISNSVLAKESIEVAPKGNLNARIVFFNTVYAASPANTIHVVREAIRQVENVSPKKRPVVRIRNLGESGIEWEVKYWLEDYTKHNDTDALIRERIWYVFKREKIESSFPMRIIQNQEKLPEIAVEEKTNIRTEILKHVPIFDPLSDEEIERLAAGSKGRVYAPGEAIVRKGQEGGSMFIITRGSVKVQIPEKDYQKTLNQLHENDFFGEMSLLTGEPRSANVIAIEETEVLQIRKVGLKPILENNPRLVQLISESIEERKVLLTAAAAAVEEEETDTSRKGVLKSIKKFFSLK